MAKHDLSSLGEEFRTPTTATRAAAPKAPEPLIRAQFWTTESDRFQLKRIHKAHSQTFQEFCTAAINHYLATLGEDLRIEETPEDKGMRRKPRAE